MGQIARPVIALMQIVSVMIVPAVRDRGYLPFLWYDKAFLLRALWFQSALFLQFLLNLHQKLQRLKRSNPIQIHSCQ